MLGALLLKKELNGNWDMAVVPKGDLRGTCEETPPPGAWITCTFVMFYCSPGKWRTRAMVTGTGPQGNPYAFVPDGPKDKAEARIVTCPKPKK